jgi:hypothetical protein
MRKLWATILAAGLIVGMAAPAMAASSDGTHVSFTLSGFCSFDVVLDLTTWQQVRVVHTAPDGTTTTIVTGRQSGTLTNAETGAMLPINVPDPSKITENADGSVDIQVAGPTTFALPADAPGGDSLLILNFGLVRLHVGDSFSFETVGRQVDVCAALA